MLFSECSIHNLIKVLFKDLLYHFRNLGGVQTSLALSPTPCFYLKLPEQMSHSNPLILHKYLNRLQGKNIKLTGYFYHYRYDAASVTSEK